MINVVIAGAAGRMGHALVRCLRQFKDLELVGATEQAAHAQLGQDAGTVAGVDPVGVLITSNLAAVLEQADVLIDFTYHSVVPGNMALAASLGRAVVLGTTGLTDEEAMSVHKAADKIPVMWAPNMSLGVNLLFAMSQKASQALGSSYRVVIDETHHIHKADAPSGTALRLGERVAEGAGVAFDKVYLHDEGGRMESYPEGRIVIRSHREGEVLGDHTVAFDGIGERIELKHHIKSRDSLALGALHAARWVCRQRPRCYDMQDVLGLRQL